MSPLSAVPLISLVGFGLYELGFPGVSSAPSIFFYFFNPEYTFMEEFFFSFFFLKKWMQVAKCVEIGLPELILLVAFSQVLMLFYYPLYSQKQY